MGSKKSRKRKTQSSEQANASTSPQQSTHSSAAMGAQSVHGAALADESTLYGPNPDEVYGGDPLSSGVFGHPGIAPSPSELNIQRALEGTDTSQDEVPDTVLGVLGDGGQSLDQPIQRALEERMDADFSNVRIHTGAKAAEAADAIDAKAFTCGNDIVFNSGEYNPGSGEGQFLLAHELAHVKQQTGAAISMMPQEGADLEIDPDPQLEREADEAASQALSADEPLFVSRMGADVHIQRTAKGESEYVTRGEVYEIVQNHYEGVVRNQAEQDPLEAGPERETPGNIAGKSTQATDDGGFFSNAWEKTKQVGSDLSQAVTKGAIGSLAGAGGKAVGMVGGGQVSVPSWVVLSEALLGQWGRLPVLLSDRNSEKQSVANCSAGLPVMQPSN
ncbi:DUF4157 domain-containing protein [Natronolimnobius sp. AArcel1]|uniref:eCIS core domain-containing protein n=1 Tax=Natronolimnobius sp. AArcel1 TaxID=1679093 RepID=UPI001F14ACB6|nr:DUF4157 domain-containing protein [Natronolimnobius sp. AArcel1]